MMVAANSVDSLITRSHFVKSFFFREKSNNMHKIVFTYLPLFSFGSFERQTIYYGDLTYDLPAYRDVLHFVSYFLPSGVK